MVFADIERRAVVSGHGIATFFLAAGLLLLPLGMGGNRPVPLALCQMSLAFSFFIMAIAPHNVSMRPFPQRLRVAAGLFMGVVTWALLQAAPFLPEGVHHPLWREVSETLSKPYWGAISISPESTLMAAGRLLTYGLMLLCVFLVTRNNDYAGRLVCWFWYAGLLLCTYALAAHLFAFSPFLWIEKTAYMMDATGTFVNRNHFADYAGLVLMTGVALGWRNFLHCRSYSFTENLPFSLWSWGRQYGWIYGTGVLVAFVALVMAGSRAGTVSSFIGLTVFIGCYLVYHKNYRAALNVSLICLLSGLSLVAILFQYGRFSLLMTDGSGAIRLANYDVLRDLIFGRFSTGHGLGAFEQSYMPYYNESFSFIYNRAHSDWIEMFFDLGLFGGGALALVIGLLISGCWHGVRTRRRHGIYPALGIGASALMLCHALVDFNMQIPGLVAAWLILLGTGLGQSWSRRHQRKEADKPASPYTASY